MMPGLPPRRSSTFGERLLGALRLNPEIFEEVEHDPRAIGQALVVTTLAGLAVGIGAVGVPRGSVPLVIGIVFTLGAWFVWAAIIHILGTRLLAQPQTESSLGELLRTTGFAAAPGLFGIVGVFSAPLQFLVTLWMLAAMLIAVRQALDFTSVWRAVGVVALGYIPYLALIALANAIARG